MQHHSDMQDLRQVRCKQQLSQKELQGQLSASLCPWKLGSIQGLQLLARCWVRLPHPDDLQEADHLDKPKAWMRPHSFTLPGLANDDEPRRLLAQAQVKDIVQEAAENKNDGEVSASAIDEAVGGSGCRGACGVETVVAKMQADPSEIAMLEAETAIPPGTSVFWSVRDASFGHIFQHECLLYVQSLEPLVQFLFQSWATIPGPYPSQTKAQQIIFNSASGFLVLR